MVDYDAITPLVYLLQRGSPTSRDKAAAVLGSLAAHPAYRSIVADRVQSHCRTKLLLDLLKTGTHKAKEPLSYYITPLIMENQMEKNMENDMETGLI